MNFELWVICVIPATKSPGAILNARSAARRVKGRMPVVTRESLCTTGQMTVFEIIIFTLPVLAQ